MFIIKNDKVIIYEKQNPRKYGLYKCTYLQIKKKKCNNINYDKLRIIKR